MSENEGSRKGFSNFMEEKFLPVAAKIGSQRHLLALRDGIVMIMPLLILGAFTMIIAEFPIQGYLDFMEGIFGPDWNAFSGIVVNATYGIVSLIACYGVCSSLVNSYNIDGTPAGMIALSAFFISNVLSTFTLIDGAGRIITETVINEKGEAVVQAVTKSAWIGEIFDASSLFTALIIALIAGEIYRILVQKKVTIKMPKSVPPAVSRQFTALVPGIVIMAFFLIVRGLFSLTIWETLPEFITNVIAAPFKDAATSYPGTLAAVLVEHFLWSLGLHGSSIIIFPIFEPMWYMTLAENMKGASNIVTFPFYENGVWIGGSGATLPVVVYMLVFAKSKLLKQVGKISIIPGLFNINEPVTFGLPIVLNPFLMIPFFAAPAVVMTIQYFGTAIGLFPYANVLVPWTTPFFLSGFFMTGGNIMGVVAQIVSFAVAFVIWWPFIRYWDKTNYDLELSES